MRSCFVEYRINTPKPQQHKRKGFLENKLWYGVCISRGTMQNVNLAANHKPWLNWNHYYRRGGVYIVWGPCGQAYVGLSRNVAIRLNNHHEEAKKGSHSNCKFQRMYNDANGKLSYSLVWSCKSS